MEYLMILYLKVLEISKNNNNNNEIKNNNKINKEN